MSARNEEEGIVVYIYHEKETGRAYYYNTATNGVTYDLEERMLVFDPETKQFLNATVTPQVDYGTNLLDLPHQTDQEIADLKLRAYGKTFFQKRELFKMTEFSTDVISSGLLRDHNRKSNNTAVKCFKYILGYSGIWHLDPEDSINKLIAKCQKSEMMQIEVLFQLIKQTRGGVNIEWIRKTWEIVLVMITLFEYPSDVEEVLTEHILREMESSIPEISEIAKFCYIRLTGGRNPPVVINHKAIITDCYNGTKCIGVSLYEQLWNQRSKYPKLPIPFTLHEITEELLKSGAEHSIGVFRESGDKDHTDKMAEDLNSGNHATILGAPVNDIAGLFKKWCRSSMMIPSKTQAVLNTITDGNYIPVLEEMPRACRLTLMYIVGFLQRLVKFEGVTKMNAENLGICVGPAIFVIGKLEGTDPAAIAMIRNLVKIPSMIVEKLIETWDTSEIYPLRSDLLE